MTKNLRRSGDCKVIEEEPSYSGSCSFHTASSRCLDMFTSENGMNVYCACGRIVNLDRYEMQLKISLGKELQCSHCRNQRISQEIDYLNNLYDGLVEEEFF
jgi:hypothetical protein